MSYSLKRVDRDARRRDFYRTQPPIRRKAPLWFQILAWAVIGAGAIIAFDTYVIYPALEKRGTLSPDGRPLSVPRFSLPPSERDA